MAKKARIHATQVMENHGHCNTSLFPIRTHLLERGLPSEHLFGYSDPESLTTSPAIREADIFSNDFMQHLRSKYPEDNPWTMYYQDTDAETRKAMTAWRT